MVIKLTSKAFRALLGLTLGLACLAVSLPADATVKLGWAVTAVNPEGLEAAARKHLSSQEVELLQQAISKKDQWGSPMPWLGNPATMEAIKPPLVELKQRGFMSDLIDIVKPCLARGDRAKVKQFFQVINQQKLIQGYQGNYRKWGMSGWGGPLVIQLELRQSPQKEFQVEERGLLVHPGPDGKKQEGPRRTYPTGITGP
jgi:hypothetical protein